MPTQLSSGETPFPGFSLLLSPHIGAVEAERETGIERGGEGGEMRMSTSSLVSS